MVKDPRRLAAIILGLAIIGLGLVSVIAVKYVYNPTTVIEAAGGFGILLLTIVFLGWVYRRARQGKLSPFVISAILAGISLGILWAVEISVNNFLAPPLPDRDIIDNIFWVAIALGIFVFAGIQAYRSGLFMHGLKAGFLSGLASGLMACCMALAIIVFGMPFILRDPINVAEWAARSAENIAPSMAHYFAFETFAGAFLHLIVLGVIMGGLLGILGGLIGKGINRSVLFLRSKYGSTYA